MDTNTLELGLISVVDDDQSIRIGLKRLFRSVGFDVEVFESGEEFLKAGNLRTSRCLVLDLRMHGMDGLELQSLLNSIDCRIPIVFLTAHVDEQSRNKALRAGAISFLGKPFNEESLIRDVRKAVSQHRMNGH